MYRLRNFGLGAARGMSAGQDFGDPYHYVGDCYERSPSADEWEIGDW